MKFQFNGQDIQVDFQHGVEEHKKSHPRYTSCRISIGEAVFSGKLVFWGKRNFCRATGRRTSFLEAYDHMCDTLSLERDARKQFGHAYWTARQQQGGKHGMF